jgi:hypothetical protein
VSSGGRGSYYRDNDLDELRGLAIERLERSQNDAAINGVLAEKLGAINDRDSERVNERLDELRDALAGEVEEFERFRFGGSVAKHTYVDGLSDVDSLVVLRDTPADATPADVLREIKGAIDRLVPRGQIESVTTGALAVTVRYVDGEEIQLLPALRRGDRIAIAQSNGSGWSGDIDPSRFARQLTETNQRQGRMVVPTIKLAKSLLASELGAATLSGYHVEALAVAAFGDYNGPRNYRATLTHLVRSAATDVLRPTRDITGQSVSVDESLGAARSPARMALSRRLEAVAKKLAASQSATEWRRLLE